MIAQTLILPKAAEFAPVRTSAIVLAICLALGIALAACGAPAEQDASSGAAEATVSGNPLHEPGSSSEVAAPVADEAPHTTTLPVHDSPIAGTWYPGNRRVLERMLAEMFAKAYAPADAPSADSLLAVVMPHAGYQFSGTVAASAARLLQGRETPPDRIVILGPSHRVGFQGVSIGSYSAYRTPLGEAPLDLEAIERLRRCDLVGDIARAHEVEHSVDIEIPFLQRVFGEHMPPIIPVVVGRVDESDTDRLAGAFREILTPQSLLVVSTDFTHYGPNYGYQPFPAKDDASTSVSLAGLLENAIAPILRIDAAGFRRHLDKTRDTICGRDAIALLLKMLPADARGRRLATDTSGAMTGDFENSVTYAALAFSREGGWPAVTTTPASGEAGAEPAPSGEGLSAEEKEALLQLARRSLEAAVRDQPEPSVSELLRQFPALEKERAAFVTLTIDGRLRGCIGSLRPMESLAESVRRHGRNAALDDPRFPPVRPGELAAIHVEVSALTVPEPVESPDTIRIGIDGVILEARGRSAVFLPQVAPEQGWDVSETLRHLSMKAGLPPDAWQSERARFLTFQAEVFEEPEKPGAE